MSAEPKGVRAAKRAYGLADDGSICRGVTDILKDLGWSGDGLKRHAAKVAAKEAAQGIVDGGDFDTVITRAVNAIHRKPEADAGTAAHDMIKAYLAGGDPDDAIDPFLPSDVVACAHLAFSKFVDWWPTAGYELLASEVPLVDRQSGYGGTPDLILRHRESGDVVVADTKTGKRYYDETALQLAAYGVLGRLHGYDIKRGLVIHVPVEGEPTFKDVPPALMDIMARSFAALLVIHKSRSFLKGFTKEAA